MRLWLLALATSSLTACDGSPQLWSRDEIADIAGDAADSGSAEELAIRVDELETRLSEAEARNEYQDRVLDNYEQQLDIANDRINLLQPE